MACDRAAASVELREAVEEWKEADEGMFKKGEEEAVEEVRE
jgi:hypothetical protein